MKCLIISLVPLTALLNIDSYAVRLCKAKADFKPKQHLPKQDKERVSQRCLPQHRDFSFQGCFEKENRSKPWTKQDGEDKMLMAEVSQPAWSPECLHYSHTQSSAVDFSRPSAQLTLGQPVTLLFVPARCLPWKVPWVRASQAPCWKMPCWKMLREQCHPFAPRAECSPEPGQEQGEAALKA